MAQTMQLEGNRDLLAEKLNQVKKPPIFDPHIDTQCRELFDPKELRAIDPDYHTITNGSN